MGFSTFTMLLAGIALFLFGMMIFEETIHIALGHSIKHTIQRYANSLLKSIGIGTFATAILQSSTVVTMIMLGFVGAGILTLQQGIGVVLGANIGTTLTPWLIALLGFKINIESFTLPLIAIGGVGLILGSRYPKLLMMAKFLFGFGLLFLGLGYMKESVDVLASSFSLSNAGTGLGVSILMGALITLVLQTSTGTSVMTLTALSSGMITFDIALGIMIGANIGTALSTCLVSFLSNTGKHRTKKAIAVSHVIFNILTASIVIILFDPLHWLLDISGLSQDPVVGIAAFHTLFNFIGVVCCAPAVHWYVRLIHKHGWSDKEDENKLAIQQCATTLPEEYLVAMHKDVVYLIQETTQFINDFAYHRQEHSIDSYIQLKEECEEWMSLALVYDITACNEQQRSIISNYQLTVAQLLNTIKQLKDIALHYHTLHDIESEAIRHYIIQFDEKLTHLTQIMQSCLDSRSESVVISKIEEGKQELLLDDSRFLEDIRASIARNHNNTEHHHHRSQLIKINRSIVLASESCLGGLSAYRDTL